MMKTFERDSEEAKALLMEAFQHSPFDLSPCITCSRPTICVPDGSPLCRYCNQELDDLESSDGYNDWEPRSGPRGVATQFMTDAVRWERRIILDFLGSMPGDDPRALAPVQQIYAYIKDRFNRDTWGNGPEDLTAQQQVIDAAVKVAVDAEHEAFKEYTLEWGFTAVRSGVLNWLKERAAARA